METLATDSVEQHYYVGHFGDKRLSRTGAHLVTRMVEKQSVCLRRLGGDRATEKRFGRWLAHPQVTRQEIIREGSLHTGNLAAGLHVLAIQDTSEINYDAHRLRTTGLGTLSNSKDLGLFIHPVLVLDAHSNACLGLAHQTSWVRTKSASPDYKHLPIEDKESWRWLEAAQAAKSTLHEAAQITIIADRESDIYEEWDRIPDQRTHLLTRMCRDRKLTSGENLFTWLEAQPVAACYAMEVAAKPAGKRYVSTGGGTAKRTAHRARMELRYGLVSIVRPSHLKTGKKCVPLYVVEVREAADSVVDQEAPVHWRLLTTHAITCVEDALQIVDWYCARWQIEQLFRILKKQGMEIESSQVEDGERLMKLISVAVQAAVRTLQLTLAREGQSDRCATDVFDHEDIAVMAQLQPQLEGRTDKQKNPHRSASLAWAAWIIARLGGWKGTASEAKPGPVTMLRGQQCFASIVQGWKLANMRV